MAAWPNFASGGQIWTCTSKLKFVLGISIYSKPGLFRSRGYSGHSTKCIMNGHWLAQIGTYTVTLDAFFCKLQHPLANALFISVKRLIAHWLIPKSTQLVLKISLVDTLKSSGVLTSRWSHPVFLVIPTTLGLFLGVKQGIPYRNSNHVTTPKHGCSKAKLVGCSKQAATR